MATPERNPIYQVSSISSLLAGVYDGAVTVADLMRNGDFGLGTFDGLDGEMVVLDGTCYRIRAGGAVTEAADAERTPYAAVTRFHPEVTIEVSASTTAKAVQDIVDEYAGSDNKTLAVRVDGRFERIRTRTVRAARRPYVPLVAAVADEEVVTHLGVGGTIVGFRTPRFEAALAVPGYHLHFMDAQRSKGGHVMDFSVTSGRISVMTVSELHLSFPTSDAYLGADLDVEHLGEQISQAEGGA